MTDRDRIAALEAELAYRLEGVSYAIASIEADACECTTDPDDGPEICTRCIRLAWLTMPSQVEMDALGQRAPHDPELLVPLFTLDEILGVK